MKEVPDRVLRLDILLCNKMKRESDMKSIKKDVLQQALFNNDCVGYIINIMNVFDFKETIKTKAAWREWILYKKNHVFLTHFLHHH